MIQVNAILSVMFCLASFNAYAKSPAIPPAPAPKMTMEQWKIIRMARIQSFVEHFNQNVKNGSDIEEQLLFQVKEKTRKELRPLLKTIGKMPTLKRDGETIVYIFDKNEQIPVFYEPGTSRVHIDGVIVTFDHTAPWLPQYERFLKSLPKEETAWLDWLLPRANAVTATAGKVAAKMCKAGSRCAALFVGVGAGATGALGASVGTNAGGTFLGWAGDKGCSLISGARPWESWGICEAWKDSQDKKARQAAADAVARQQRDPNRDWVPKEPECPNGDSYAARMKEIYGTAEEGNWFRFIAETKNFQITKAYVFDDENADISMPEETASIKFIYSTDTPPALKSVQFKNKDYNPKDSSDTRYLTYYLSDDPTTIDPKYRERLGKQAQFADTAQTWVNMCGKLAKASKYNRETAEATAKDMMAQPVKPVTASPTPVTVPASDEATTGK